jgi:hypothetical protein
MKTKTKKQTKLPSGPANSNGYPPPARPNSVEIKELDLRRVVIPIAGISPLIVHAWSEKAKKEIGGKQAGIATNRKHEIRDPEQEYEAAKHISPLGFEGFPAAGFKAAMVRGSKSLGMVMKDVQTAFFIEADCQLSQLVKIDGESRFREDMVRVGMGSADLRYRPEYPEWSATLVIEFNNAVLSAAQVYQLVKTGGYTQGIGEMRPEKGKFNYGRFKLAQEQ